MAKSLPTYLHERKLRLALTAKVEKSPLYKFLKLRYGLYKHNIYSIRNTGM